MAQNHDKHVRHDHNTHRAALKGFTRQCGLQKPVQNVVLELITDSIYLKGFQLDKCLENGSINYPRNN